MGDSNFQEIPEPHFDIDSDATEEQRDLICRIEVGIDKNPHVYEKALELYKKMAEKDEAGEPIEGQAMEALLSSFYKLNDDLVSNSDFTNAHNDILLYFKGEGFSFSGFDEATEDAIRADRIMADEKLRSSGSESLLENYRILRLSFFIGRVASSRQTKTKQPPGEMLQDTA